MNFETLARTGDETRFFLRDGDIDIAQDTLVTRLAICRAHGVPVTLASIPGRPTDECACLLKERLSNAPRSFELHQHGWMHLNHEATGKKCEFSPSRVYDQQRDD